VEFWKSEELIVMYMKPISNTGTARVTRVKVLTAVPKTEYLSILLSIVRIIALAVYWWLDGGRKKV